VVLLAVALLLFLLRGWARPGRPRLAGAAGAALALLGAVSFLSWDGFGRFGFPQGLSAPDVYHYYVGSKYAPELGYYRLYDCTLAALVEQGLVEPGEVPAVRNLRSFRKEPPGAALRRGRDCRRRFGRARWERFAADVRFFDGSGRKVWENTLGDAGYHPSPVWSLVGGLLAWTVDPGSPAFRAAILADRGLVLLALLGVAWAFGPGTAGLAAVVWGTGTHWNFFWMGDLYLRHLWLALAVGGLCFLRRERHAAAGALLATATLLRIFPGVFLASYALHAGWERWRGGRLPPGAVRLAAGAAVAGVLLVPASMAYVGRGPGIYAEFADKIGHFSRTIGVNNVGLRVATVGLARNLLDDSGPEGRWGPLQPATWTTARALRGATVVVFALLFALALRRAAGWEAAALGFAWIPLLASPTNYYYTFVLAAALLASARPAVGGLLLLACIAWNLEGWGQWRWDDRFMVGASGIAVALSLAVVLAVAWRGAPGRRLPAPAGAGAGRP